MNAILTQLGKIFLDWLFSKLGKLVKQIKAGLDRSKVNKDNLVKYEDAVKSGDLDAIAKSGENLLNGNSAPNP